MSLLTVFNGLTSTHRFADPKLLTACGDLLEMNRRAGACRDEANVLSCGRRCERSHRGKGNCGLHLASDWLWRSCWTSERWVLDFNKWKSRTKSGRTCCFCIRDEEMRVTFDETPTVLYTFHRVATTHVAPSCLAAQNTNDRACMTY